MPKDINSCAVTNTSSSKKRALAIAVAHVTIHQEAGIVLCGRGSHNESCVYPCRIPIRIVTVNSCGVFCSSFQHLSRVPLAALAVHVARPGLHAFRNVCFAVACWPQSDQPHKFRGFCSQCPKRVNSCMLYSNRGKFGGLMRNRSTPRRRTNSTPVRVPVSTCILVAFFPVLPETSGIRYRFRF